MSKIDSMFQIKHTMNFLQFVRTCQELGNYKKRLQAINSMWNLKSTPDDTIGVQQNIGERLQIRMKTLIENTPANATFKMK